MTVTLRRADITCAKEIWGMQKVAFRDLLVKYQDFETNPANEPLDKVIIRLKQPFTYFYFIEVDGTKIGAIRTALAGGSLIQYCKKPATVICMKNWDIQRQAKPKK